MFVEEPDVFVVDSEGEEIVMQKYFYAVETYDGELVPLIYVSEIITEEDKDHFILISETVFSQMEYSDADKAAAMVMEHTNRNRSFPVWIEVIRVSE